MHTLETSGKPSTRSEVALLNSAPSRSPRSIAGTISPPGSALTAAPMPVKTSIEMPTVRNFMPLKSSTLVIGFLYQPSGCVHIGPYGDQTTLAARVRLAVLIHEHAVTAVERALGDRVEQAERRHDRAGRQHLDLEVAAGHVVHLLRVVERVLMEDVLLRPGALPAEADRALRLDDHRETERCAAGRGTRGASQELAARGLRLVLLDGHCSSCLT